MYIVDRVSWGPRFWLGKQKKNKKTSSPNLGFNYNSRSAVYIYIYLFILSPSDFFTSSPAAHMNSIYSYKQSSVVSLSLSLSLQFSVFTHTSQLLVSVAHSYLLFITFQKEKKKKEKRDGFWLSRNPSAAGLLFYIGWASLIFNKNEIIPFVLSYCTGHTQLPHSNWLSPINFVS